MDVIAVAADDDPSGYVAELVLHAGRKEYFVRFAGSDLVGQRADQFRGFLVGMCRGERENEQQRQDDSAEQAGSVVWFHNGKIRFELSSKATESVGSVPLS